MNKDFETTQREIERAFEEGMAASKFRTDRKFMDDIRDVIEMGRKYLDLRKAAKKRAMNRFEA